MSNCLWNKNTEKKFLKQALCITTPDKLFYKTDDDKSKLNRVIVAFTTRDFDFSISEEMIAVFQEMFYKTYYDSFKESFENFLMSKENGTRIK